MSIDKKGLLLQLLFGRWRRSCPFEDGYTILLPSPMDMPFLLRYALEGLLRMDTTHCRQILIVPDGQGHDRGRALAEVAGSFSDPRIELVRLRPLDYKIIRSMKPPGSAATHWMAVVNGILHARGAHAFLHDADAFFLESGGLERQYRECLDRGMFTLGVTPRNDPDFLRLGYQIPGTWELMFSNRWARSRSPYQLKGRRRSTDRGEILFDSMLYPQFIDYPTGKVGVMAEPPKFVHFNGTIFTYRLFRDRKGGSVVDELFRILLLAILEELVPSKDGTRVVPRVDELAAGLTDPSATVTYGTRVAVQEYPIFRSMIEEMCRAPIMEGERAARIVELIRPFDDHFAAHKADPTLGSLVGHRTAGLG
ncbi:hypothetical protein P12x_006024 (plasmid) [Tundrisphaera lichenicola]|uniref:hypothetical protein n=1 Tax=Tundrisphaera lichenicola TaxID=2029860 RepID=UPI003EB79C50